MFFDARRYDLARVGRYKYNKKACITRTVLKVYHLAEDVVDMTTGEVIAEAGTVVTEELGYVRFRMQQCSISNDSDRY
ncbi:MAG: hypothetical protein ACLUR5_17760 [Eubacterium ventriosum]